MHQGGRPKDAIWQYFEALTVDDKSYAKCRFCGNQQLAKAVRLRQHVERHHSEVLFDSPAKKRKLTESVADLEESCHGPSGNQTSTATSVVPTTIDDLDKEMAKMFYSGNISFNFAENPQFLKVGKSS